MHSRAVEDAAARLSELRHQQWEQFALAALAFGLAVAATRVRPTLALPLLFGGLALVVLGVRAGWRHWDLVDRLAGDRDAYVIPEVLTYALRETTLARRHGFAAAIRSSLSEPDPGCPARLVAVSKELETLAAELDDSQLELDPDCAVACARLLQDPAVSPLLNPALRPEELRSSVRRIRSGFRSPGERPPLHS